MVKIYERNLGGSATKLCPKAIRGRGTAGAAASFLGRPNLGRGRHTQLYALRHEVWIDDKVSDLVQIKPLAGCKDFVQTKPSTTEKTCSPQLTRGSMLTCSVVHAQRPT
eukprot:2875605-Prymnesium_polylepis.1